MKTKEQKTDLIGLEELNESGEKEVSGGLIGIGGIGGFGGSGCCGFVIATDPDIGGILRIPNPWDDIFW